MNLQQAYFRWLVGFASLLLLCLSGLVAVWGYPQFNENLFLTINALGSCAGWFWQNITVMGEGLVAFVALASFSRRDGHFIRTLLLAALIAGLASQLLKHLLDMPRPAAILAPGTFNLIGAELRAHAFPSGHATTALVAAVMCSWRFPKLSVAAYGFFALVAVSRVVVGAHWPFDVLAGACVGYLCAHLSRYLALRKPPSASRWLALLSWGLLLLLALWLTVFPLDYPAAQPLVWVIAGGAASVAVVNISQLLRQ